MAVLARFDTPGRVSEPDEVSRDAWSHTVGGIFGDLTGEFPQFYDPTVDDTPSDAVSAPVGWPAFPATLLRGATTQEGRWQLADDRSRQDEYCEWSVERDDDGAITRVTFTTEVPELWGHVAAHDPDRLLALYRQLVDERVRPDDLFENGSYVRANRWNVSAEGRLAHLVNPPNTLEAAVRLAAQATVQRVDAQGRPVRDQQILVRCGALGEEFRSSDPRIAAAVNNAAATGAAITLRDPLGLYLDSIDTSGMVARNRGADHVDFASFWTVERGVEGFTVRANFAVPADLGFRVGDMELDGRPITFGAQLADRVIVRITALVKPGAHEPRVEGCVD